MQFTLKLLIHKILTFSLRMLTKAEIMMCISQHITPLGCIFAQVGMACIEVYILGINKMRHNATHIHTHTTHKDGILKSAHRNDFHVISFYSYI